MRKGSSEAVSVQQGSYAYPSEWRNQVDWGLLQSHCAGAPDSMQVSVCRIDTDGLMAEGCSPYQFQHSATAVHKPAWRTFR